MLPVKISLPRLIPHILSNPTLLMIFNKPLIFIIFSGVIVLLEV